MGNIISGRYGSVQRVLPDGNGGWHKLDDDLIIRAGQQPLSPATAASLTDEGTILSGSTTDHHSTVSAVTSWSLENTMQPITYVASNTRGYQGKLEGVHSATGNIAGIGAIPPIAPGQRFLFYGYVGPASQKLDDYEGVVYRVAAIANSVQIQINYQLTNPITWTVGWQSDWQQAGDELWCNQYDASFAKYGFWDYTNLDCGSLLPSDKNCLSIEGIENPVCLLDANIQFQTETSQFTNSCSSKVGGWQSSVVGPTSCTVSANIHGDNYGDLYSKARVAEYYGVDDYDTLKPHQQNRKFWPGSNHTVKIAVGDNAFWEFKKLMFTNFGGLNVDTTNNNPVQFSCNMEFNAFPPKDEGEGCEPGYIVYARGEGNNRIYTPLIDLRPGGGDYGYEYQSNEESCSKGSDADGDSTRDF